MKVVEIETNLQGPLSRTAPAPVLTCFVYGTRASYRGPKKT